MEGYESLKELAATRGRDLNFDVVENANYGAGEIDVVWKHRYHPNLPTYQVGFVCVPDAERLQPDDIPPFLGLPLISPLDDIVLVTDSQAGMEKLNGLLARFREMEGWLNLPEIITVVTARELAAREGPVAEEAAAR